MRERLDDVRRRCEEALHALDLPRPFTLEALCGSLEADRGRPLRLLPLPIDSASPCGLWVSTNEADYVFHQTVTSGLHQEHIVLHELAHMILGHDVAHEAAEDLRTELVPKLDPNVVASVLARTSYSSAQEQEAETLADLIGSHAVRRRVQAGADETFARLRDVLDPAP